MKNDRYGVTGLKTSQTLIEIILHTYTYFQCILYRTFFKMFHLLPLSYQCCFIDAALFTASFIMCRLFVITALFDSF